MACHNDEPQPEEVNANDLSVLRELYETAQLSRTLCGWNFSSPKEMRGVTWESIGGELRVTRLSIGTSIANPVPHELSPRIGELTHLRLFSYKASDVEGEWPREIYNCPLETLILEADNNNRMKGGLCPEMVRVSETLKCLSISYTDLSFDNGEVEWILACKNLETLLLQYDNLSGEIPAAFGDCNYSMFNLSWNKFTSIDWDIINGSGTAFPNVHFNRIAQEVPYWAQKKLKWDRRWREVHDKLVGCDHSRGPYLEPAPLIDAIIAF